MNEQALPREVSEATSAPLVYATAIALSVPIPTLPSLTTLTFDFWKELLHGDLTPWYVGTRPGWSRQ